MNARTVSAFLLGAALTAAVFLVVGSATTSAPNPEEPGGTLDRDAIDREAEPVLRGSPPAALEELPPSAEETVWMREALLSERARREKARIRDEDTGVDILRRVFDHGADPTPLFASYEVFRRPIVEAETATLTLTEPRHGETVSFRDEPHDHVVIELGPGVFPLDEDDRRWSPLRDREKAAERAVIRGAGMDRTTLVAGHQWALARVAFGVEHLVIRDLTFSGGEEEGALLDVSGRAAVALERVRVSGWKRAGHAAAIGVSGNAYLACKDCEFVGRGENGGWAITLRGPSLVLCEGCHFLHLRQGALTTSIKNAGSGAVALRDCTFVASPLCDRRLVLPVRVFGGVVEIGPASSTEDERRSLWGAEHAEALEGVSFHPVRPVCTLGDLLAVIKRLELPDGEQLLEIRLDGVERGEPSHFRIKTLRRKGRSPKFYRVDVNRGLPELTYIENGWSESPAAVEALRRARSFVAVLERSSVPMDTELSSLELRLQAGDPQTPMILIRAPAGQLDWLFDASTGRQIGGPR